MTEEIKECENCERGPDEVPIRYYRDMDAHFCPECRIECSANADAARQATMDAYYGAAK